jgi:predicted RNase H-like HicB family nuclease
MPWWNPKIEETMDTDLIEQYQIITYWSNDDNAFIAEIPDLPGCLSDGPTEAEARRNIRGIAQGWINRARYLGREIPRPTTAHQPLAHA